MASTYSELKLELITTGEQSGTWGDTTNTNLDIALGEAITGSADVTFASADVNLTLTDTNASQTARNLRLNLVGTVATFQTLYLSTGCNIEKLYLIKNNLNWAITVRNKIAGTPSGSSVSVQAGASTFIYNTGTDIVDAVTYLSSLSLSTPLPLTSGGTGVTTGTGGGSVVFSNSPTLVSPALGTPANGVLTNCTGYTYANLAGTVPTWNQNTTGNALTATSATSATTATNLAGGAATKIPYQTGASTTSFIDAPSVTNTYLQWNGTAYVWAGSTGGTSASLTFNNGGAGSASGVAFNGSTAYTISYNTIGASPLAGSTSITTLGTVTTGTWSATAIGATYGGTGQTSYAVGDLLYASTTSALSKLAGVATGNALISGGVSTAPSWGKIGLTTHVSGTLPVANGGTGVTTSTGSGSVVLSTSPTLVTPALGTPSSGNLSNCTSAGSVANALTAGTGLRLSSGTTYNGSAALTVNAIGTTLNSQISAYILVASDAGKMVSITAGGVTVNNSVMSAGDIVTIYNNSGSSQTITQGTGVTLQWAGQAISTTGTRTLGLYGIATIVFLSASSAVITGSGLT